MLRLQLLLLLVSIFASAASAQFGGLTAGRINTGFGSQGVKFLTNAAAYNDVDILPNGKLLYAESDYSNIRIRRFYSDGEPDNSFGLNGVSTFAFRLNNVATKIKYLPDGKILVVGVSAVDDESGDLLVFRLLPNGIIDDSFGVDGATIVDFPSADQKLSSNDKATSIEVLDDGKFLISGISDQYSGTQRATSYFVLLKLNADGSKDLSFGNQGIKGFLVGNNEHPNFINFNSYARSFKISGGKIVTGVVVDREDAQNQGAYNRESLLIKFDDNGNLDTSFSDDGILEPRPGVNTFVSKIIEFPKGRLIASLGQFLLAIHDDGSLDTTFGNNGALFPGQEYWTNDIFVSNGKIILAGNKYLISSQLGMLKRFYATGEPDRRFGVLGTTTLDIGNSTAFAKLFAQQSQLVVLGSNFGSPGGFFIFTSRFYLGK